MLQEPLFIQVITAISAIIVFTISMYLIKRAEKDKYEDELIVAVALFLVSAILTYCFIRNILTTSDTFEQLVAAVIKIIIFFVVNLEIFFYYTKEYKQIGLQIIMIIFITISSIVLVSAFGMHVQKSNEKKLENQNERIETIVQYEVLEN